MPTCTSELFDELLRPEFTSWKVIRRDKAEESFDPLTLINSFLESEVDLRAAFELFDKTVARLEQFVQGGPITHELLHSTVVEVLLDSPDQRAPFWVSNYENIFGPSIEELVPQAGLVNVRHASELRRSILVTLAGRLGIEGPEAVERVLGQSETTTITNRLIKIIRYCGFYKMDRTFLESFCQELAEHSIKGIVPRTSVNEVELHTTLDEADRLLTVAKSECSQNSTRALNFLELVIEELGRVSLTRFGLLPRSASKKSFRLFVEVLITAREIVAARDLILPLLSRIGVEIRESLERQSIPLERFIGECEELSHTIERRLPERACAQTGRILRNLRIVLCPSASLNALHAFEYPESSTSSYLRLAEKIFIDSGLRATCNGNAEWLDVEIDFSFHELIELGRRVRLRCSFASDEEGLPPDWLSGVQQDVESSNDVISAVVLNKDLSKEQIDQLRNEIQLRRRCMTILSRSQFEKVLRHPDEIRTAVLTQFERIFPEGRSWRGNIFPEQQFTLPGHLADYQKSILSDAFQRLRHGHRSEACLSAARVLEVALREYVQMIYSVIRFGVRRQVNTIGAPADPERSMGKYINWLRDLSRHFQTHPDLRRNLAGCLLTSRVLDEMYDLRETRNEFAHTLQEISELEAKTLFERMVRLIGVVEKHSSPFVRAVVTSVQSGQLIVALGDGTLEFVKQGASHDQTSIIFRMCVLVSNIQQLFSVIPLMMFCAECRDFSFVYAQNRDGKGACGNGHYLKIDRPWRAVLERSLR